MRIRKQLLLIASAAFLLSGFLAAGEMSPPKNIADKVANEKAFTTPGVYPLGADSLLVVGEGRVTKSLRETRALRLAQMLAERDALRRLGAHLHPDAPRLARLDVSGRQAVSEKHVDGGESRVYMGFVVSPSRVKLIMPAAAQVFAEFREVKVHPAVMEAMAKAPLLADGGGRVFETEEGWLAIGVGYAAIDKGGNSQDERQARKIARVNAAKELSEAVFGAWMQVVEKDGSAHMAGMDGERFREWSVKLTREQVTGELANVEEAGSWLTDDGELAVVSVLARPALIWDDDGSDEEQTVADLEMDDDWREAFRRRPQWWHGGAGVARIDGALMAVAVGGAKLKGEPLYDRTRAPMAAELDARRNFLKYFSGFTSDTVTTDVEELMEEFAGDAKSARAVELFRKTAREDSGGLVKTMRKVASWKSGDGATLFSAYAITMDGFSGR